MRRCVHWKANYLTKEVPRADYRSEAEVLKESVAATWAKGVRA